MEQIRALIAAGRLAEAEIACYKLQADHPQDVDRLLAEIDHLSRQRDSVEAAESYHRWYYNTLVWKNVRWLGVQVFKSPMDLWSYQEIITELRPNLIIEFGTHAGGSALYFADLLRALAIEGEVITVDISMKLVPDLVKDRDMIRFIEDSSISPAVRATLQEATLRRPGKIFAILDSDHARDHVYAEMVMLRDILKPGDYLVVEDSNINGHPVLPEWGPGPFEAVELYAKEFPDDYTFDGVRERKFGFTFAPRGFLVRN